ncbi:MAG: hypothetical protein ACRD4I_00455, partial [Candidatus Angelobacter sp.]
MKRMVGTGRRFPNFSAADRFTLSICIRDLLVFRVMGMSRTASRNQIRHVSRVIVIIGMGFV